MTLTASQAEWLRVRSYLQEHRHALAVDAAAAVPAERRVAGTPLLAAPEWQPAEPVPLHDIESRVLRPAGDTPAGDTPANPRPAAVRAGWVDAGWVESLGRNCPSGRTGPATAATRTRCGTWPPRPCSRTAPPTG